MMVEKNRRNFSNNLKSVILMKLVGNVYIHKKVGYLWWDYD